ncbi:hypothetical protein F4782DRAFT_531416 [Xylaria castorea]|nr:hypothetical protein F4782DRAFT_531416 [Xylaria castorea]
MAENKSTADHDSTTFGGPLYAKPTTAATPIWHQAMKLNDDPLVAPHLSVTGLCLTVVGSVFFIAIIVWYVMHRRRQRHEPEEGAPILLQNLTHPGIQVLQLAPGPRANGMILAPMRGTGSELHAVS